MSSIRIIAIPPGFAPEDIRKQWVGVEIRLPTQEEIDIDPPSPHSIGNENVDGHIVLRQDAIDALAAAGHQDAAGYWEMLVITRFLRFKQEVCELVE